MTPLPPHVRATYDAYAELTLKVQRFARQNLINNAEALVILLLGDRTMTPTEIREELLLVPSNISYTLTGLQKRRLIRRVDRPDSRKSHFIKLTDKGLQLCANLREELAEKVKVAA